ncbi:hypothetical protein [Streptacidiphilus jiangxiensis]|uniref:Uncharacterized protein n=1 Tax=Streptacidiphilus jiangxiensis TaxID=235985 RepID=A0A1H7FHS5_STRJI|nr:hypothetical protein [Streptacidiphilus jiangxiensis]SEK25571.1 hypothetical protein SAMN05414137_101265 [Streptacidiphilus jiangxiensis]
MGRRHLTLTAVAAGIGTALTIAVSPYASSGGSPVAPVHTASTASAVFTPAGSARTNGTPYLVGGAGFLLAGAGLVVVRRRIAL